MILADIGFNQLSKDGLDWYVRYLSAFDAKDKAAYAAFFAEDCVMQLGNNAPVYSVRSVLPVVERVWERYRSLDHEIVALYGMDRRFAAELIWHFVRLDGHGIIVPAAATIGRDAKGLVQSLRVYSNIAPAFDARNVYGESDG